jgi:hypothetical protein
MGTAHHAPKSSPRVLRFCYPQSATPVYIIPDDPARLGLKGLHDLIGAARKKAGSREGQAAWSTR